VLFDAEVPDSSPRGVPYGPLMDSVHRPPALSALAGVALLLLLVAACAGDPTGEEVGGREQEGPAGGSVAEDGTVVDPALLEPLTALGPCAEPPEPPEGLEEADLPEGLVLPPTTTVTHLNDTGPLTQARGYIERTPVEIRVFYADGSAGVDVLTIEDEVREVEALVTDGSTRLFVKAQAVCERGSAFVAFLAAAGEADRLPEPALGGN
jgi:hypothetical protein